MSKEKILVVEDAPDISSLLKIYFTSQGYEVMTALRGQTALEICRKTPPNLALLDVNLPDMEGYEIGKVLRQSARTRHIPIIFLTARGEKQDRLKGLGEVQAEYYIVKPFDIEEVHTIVKGALDRARQKNLTHPVTNLPTAELINEQYRALLSSSGWALALVHINGFDAFTQSYGAMVGEEVLKFTALLISEAINELGRPEDFAGQMIVGPSFCHYVDARCYSGDWSAPVRPVRCRHWAALRLQGSPQRVYHDPGRGWQCAAVAVDVALDRHSDQQRRSVL